MFDLWLVTLFLGPVLLAIGSAYMLRRYLASPTLYAFIGVIGLWGIASVIAFRILGSIGVSGGASAGSIDGERYLGASLIVFVMAAIAFLFVLRFCMPKRVL